MHKDEELLIALRRVIRAIDLRSKQLNKSIGLTGPQLLVLRFVGQQPGVMVRQIANNINLSKVWFVPGEKMCIAISTIFPPT